MALTVELKSVDISPNDCPLEQELTLKMKIATSEEITGARWSVKYLVDTVHSRKIIHLGDISSGTIPAGESSVEFSTPRIDVSGVPSEVLANVGLLTMTLEKEGASGEREHVVDINMNSGAMQSTATTTARKAASKGASGASSSSSSSVEWGSEMGGDNYCVREVWAKDLDHELQLMEKLVEEYPYVAVDGRFPGVVARPTGPFKDDTERNYDIVRSNMELVKIVQLSLAFANEDGEVASHPEDVRRGATGKKRRSPPPPRCVWKINFQFDFRKDLYCADALKRLMKPIAEGGAGIDFNTHRLKGVSVDRFSELITGSGLVMSPDVRWITVEGSFLFAGLVRMLSGQVLPKTEEEFSDMCYEYFPNIRDLRACRWCSKKCGNPPRVPLHACASERAILEACGRDGLKDTSPTLAMIDVFFKHGGALEALKGSGSDDSSVSSSLQNSDNLLADNSSVSTGLRRPSARWAAVLPKPTRRPSQFALWEFSAIHLSSPAAIWRESGMDVVNERVRLREKLEKEEEQEATLPSKSEVDVTASQPASPPPPPPPPGPPPPATVDVDAHSTSSASPTDRQHGPGTGHRHPLRHPKYPHGAPPPMSGAIAYKGPPVQKKVMQRSLHWGCVQVPGIPSAHGRGRHNATPPTVMAGGNGGDQGRRRGGGRL
ncbi:CCR4-NOT transcription complex subunit 8 [Perkinsus chesapeaki]|uniref:CCR4-NOT transcription complex subunit 8 n=1 Tax=Perkinsus chesapeaki TaxID=330153 RepID=A0A7J6N158_PERCH|nr:CCR4-NOT transcription complex subunit 8 [Perkinsus chesapeaki]